ncbi:hypothetical protein L2E82_01261 [Cichorium intybus]|uniref:Uncharacterized protein n=1 Tax=Cichorium intybus TaxID=13427 RepID=A0ACB9GZI4_CICIN|nr:hypothetical protein L2E82_01261 [Cichorium intybus]
MAFLASSDLFEDIAQMPSFSLVFSRPKFVFQNLQVRLGRLSAGSTKPAKNVLDELLSSNEGGKHDYDWLLTPPGTPPLSSSDGKESQPQSVAARRNPSVRSGSAVQNSRLSVSQSESSHPSRPVRSTSATRSAISTTQYTNRNPNILNTSSASVSSYIRPSTPTNRSSSAARPSAISSRTTSRASTPSRSRPSTTTASGDRTTKPSNNSRPSTPTPSAIRPSSRPSTPTRRSPTPSSTSSPSAGRSLSSNGRSAGPTSRPSSPSPRVRPPPQPIVPPDFPHETPPNLRTTLPERPLSASRSRPGAAMTTNGSTARRQSSPIVTKGRIIEPPSRRRPNTNGHVIETSEPRRTLHVPESLTKKPIKSDNGAGFGRNISKKSLDMAIKHMDIRNGGIRSLSGSALFPQSIRSGNPRMQPGRAASGPGSIDSSKNGSSYSSKIMEAGIYESSRYDAILLKEDSKNTSWLHSAEEKSDEGPLFDNGFESLPEPFSPL